MKRLVAGAERIRKRIAPHGDAPLHIRIVRRCPPRRGAEDRGRTNDQIETARRDVEHRDERRQQQRRHAEIAFEHQHCHRGAPAKKQRAEIFRVGAQRPRARLCDDVGRFGQVRRHEEHDEEFDQLDRFELNRTDADPEPRAVHLLSEQRERHEQHDRAQDPEVLVGGQDAEAREGGARDDREDERERNPHDLALGQRGLEPRDHREPDRRQQDGQRGERVVAGDRGGAQRRPRQREHAERVRKPSRHQRAARRQLQRHSSQHERGHHRPARAQAR